MRTSLGVAGVLLALSGSSWGQQPAESAAAFELAQVRSQLGEVTRVLRERTEALETTEREVRAMGRELDGVKERLSLLLAAPVVAAPFLHAPPPSSDTVGVAKLAVLQPRLEIDSPLRHDVVFFKLLRIETGSVRLVAERELTASEYSLELPIDQSGGLYVVNWSTAEGFNFPLVLRDGATLQIAATVQIKQLQREGRFVFVGYRLE
jgi:hypothetical protein